MLIKIRFFLLFVALSITQAYSQNTGRLEIKLAVTDSLSGRPVLYATVRIIDDSTKVTKVLVASEKGYVEFDKSRVSAIQISAVGYDSKFMNLGKYKISDNLSIAVFLVRSTKELKEVNIISNSPVMKREIDRLVYNVQSDPEKNILSVNDILHKMPLISGDGSNLLLNGSSSYRVFINGKPSSLFTGNAAVILSQMEAANIKGIEIITTPPSKYESEGIAGIINILVVKQVAQGYNGRVGVGYKDPNGPSGSGAFSFRLGRFAVSIFGGDSKLSPPALGSNLTRISNEGIFKQSGINKTTTYFPYGHLEASFEADSSNLITLQTNFKTNNGNSHKEQGNFLYQDNGALENFYNLKSVNKTSSSGFDIGLDYEIKLNRKQNEMLTFSYQNRSNDEKLTSNTEITNNQPSITGNTVIPVNNHFGSKENTFQIDYIRNFKPLNLEAGVKTIVRNNFSNIEPQSNEFNYDQDVYAFYNTYTIKRGKIEYKGGFRLEDTRLGFKDSSELERSYLNILPAVSVLYTVDDKNSLSLGYTMRIERPDYIELNPFIDNSDPRSLSTGNPYLNPSRSNNFEMNYSHFDKTSVNLGLTYSKVKDGADIVTIFFPGSNTYVSTYQNVINSSRLGFNNSFSPALGTNYSLMFNSDISYNKITGNVDGDSYNNHAYLFNAYLSLSRKFQKDFTVTLNSGYNSGILLLQAKTNHIISYSLSAGKQVYKKKLSISASVNNLFNRTRNYTIETTAKQSYQIFSQQNYNRTFAFNLTYRFGQLKSGAKTNERKIFNDDLKIVP